MTQAADALAAADATVRYWKDAFIKQTERVAEQALKLVELRERVREQDVNSVHIRGQVLRMEAECEQVNRRIHEVTAERDRLRKALERAERQSRWRSTPRNSTGRCMTEAQLGAQFSSATDEWETPQEFFNLVDSEFHFTLDVCASHENTKCERYFTKDDDGLKQEWAGVCWMNPPYGRKISHWIKKAYESSLAGATVVCLLPARTDTRWWHDYIQGKAEVRFIRGRLKFGGSKNSAPFPSVIVVFGKDARV